MEKKIYQILFLLGLFFFPFNEYEGIPALGEFKTESGALFLFTGVVFLGFEIKKTRKLRIPFKDFIFQILILFLAWCFVCSLLNFPSINESYFKHTAGLNRFFRQYFSLLISSFFFFILYWNVLINLTLDQILYKIRKVFLYSLIVASVYGFLETMVSFFGIAAAYPILKLFDYFPFLEVSLHAEGRISSISYEPPFFAIYLITIAGWMFSYILTEKSIFKYTPTVLVLALTFFSGSRTGLMVVSFQFIVLGFFMYKQPEFKRTINRIALGVASAAVLLVIFNGPRVIKSFSEKIESLDFKGNLKKNVSNKSRFGMQYAALQVFKEHPIVGVGFGQQTYYSRTKYPYWATSNNYEYSVWYKNKNEKAFPPAYNIYTRLMAETGIIGIIIFISLVYFSIKKNRKFIRNSDGNKKILAIVTYISLVGLFINWMQIDSFRIYGLWLSIAILIRFSYDFEHNEQKHTINTSLQ